MANERAKNFHYLVVVIAAAITTLLKIFFMTLTIILMEILNL